MFANHYSPTNVYGDFASYNTLTTTATTTSPTSLNNPNSDTSSPPPLYHQHPHMFSAAHFSNDKLQSSPATYPSFSMHGLNMNVNVTMNPAYMPMNNQISPSAPLKPFYSSDDNGSNPLEGKVLFFITIDTYCVCQEELAFDIEVLKTIPIVLNTDNRKRKRMSLVALKDKSKRIDQSIELKKKT